MAPAKQGDSVKVHYTGKLTDGTLFDTSAEREPMHFIIGADEVIPGFEAAIIGMNPGDSKTVVIQSENAYGPHFDEMVQVVPLDLFPPDIQPKVDHQYQVHQDDGQVFIVRVTEIKEAQVTLDGNHPLAGQDLHFEIQLVEIE
ncbi:MAG: peptidylprolyl isomerase [bacterium]|nr:peptidylprolyl isomerase [bacterium]